MNSTQDMIKEYFYMGFHQKEILLFLKTRHGISISLRTLKRRLRQLGLFRRHYSRFEDIYSFLLSAVTSAQLHGYRWMHLKCIQNGFVVSQNTVREILHQVDREGVEFRTRRRLRRRQYSSNGPKYLWHLDSYNKLKKFGICINGCIDGFSRHIIWLRASCTSSDPKIIANYYLTAIGDLNGCPLTVRSDCGTENGNVEALQTLFRDLYGEEHHNRPSHIRGRSTANQRIESWWAIFRKENSQFWINLFECIRDEGLFTGSYLDKALVQYCFMEIIQKEMDQLTYQWNTHRIRRSRNANAPTGRPIFMFETLENYGCANYIVRVPAHIINILKEDHLVSSEVVFCDSDVKNLCDCIMLENQWVKEFNPTDAINLYRLLRNEVLNILNQI